MSDLVKRIRKTEGVATDSGESLRLLQEMQSNSIDGSMRFDFKLNGKDESLPLQSVVWASKKEVDDFQRFWLWVGGLEKAPDWFDILTQSYVINQKILNASSLPRLTTHLEQFSGAVLKGNQLIVVLIIWSHIVEEQCCVVANMTWTTGRPRSPSERLAKDLLSSASN